MAIEAAAELRDDAKPPRETKARKQPSRARGRRRVEALLQAAAQVFVEKGYDAATMTEIAAYADASIGSLYQFFPTKASIADTLRIASGEYMCREWEALRVRDDITTPEALARELLAIATKMLADFPAFVPLLSVRGKQGENLLRVRERMNQAMHALLARQLPNATRQQVKVATIIVRETMRCRVDIEETKEQVLRRRALADLQSILTDYLASKWGQTS